MKSCLQAIWYLGVFIVLGVGVAIILTLQGWSESLFKKTLEDME